MLPQSMLRHSCTISRRELTGNGYADTTTYTDQPCLVTQSQRSQMAPDGLNVYTEKHFILQSSVDVVVGDTIEYGGTIYQVYDIRNRLAPNLTIDHIEAVCW